MPNLANITVKKSDGTTDVVYDGLAPSSGNGTDAVWRQDTGANPDMPVGHRAMLTLSATDNGPKTARRLVGVSKRPYSTLNAASGKFEFKDQCVMRVEATIPGAIPATEINEFVHQSTNAFASALIKACLSAGYSAS